MPAPLGSSTVPEMLPLTPARAREAKDNESKSASTSEILVDSREERNLACWVRATAETSLGSSRSGFDEAASEKQQVEKRKYEQAAVENCYQLATAKLF
jgi:hypothetical protein